MNKMRCLVILAFVFAATAVLGIWGYSQFVKAGDLQEDKAVVIPKGASIEYIAILLGKHNIIQTPIILSIAARTFGAKANIKAGEFLFPKYVSPKKVLYILQYGKQVSRRLTIVEGLTSSAILKILKNTEGLVGEISVSVEEGDLLPETYYFSYGDTINSVIKRMKSAMNVTLADLWKIRDEDLLLSTPREALILASIVEKETGRTSERPRVAGVFLNRLRLNMRLQSDPTVYYSVTNGKRVLKRALTLKDLRVESPYNTYVVHGLPPGAISNPGRASIKAVVQPQKSSDLYFVANGMGGHSFATNLNEHNRNVLKWRNLNK